MDIDQDAMEYRRDFLNVAIEQTRSAAIKAEGALETCGVRPAQNGWALIWCIKNFGKVKKRRPDIKKCDYRIFPEDVGLNAQRLP